MSIIRKARFLITRSHPIKMCTLLMVESTQANEKFEITDIEAAAYIPGTEDQVTVAREQDNANQINFYLSTQQGDAARVVIYLETGDCFYAWLSGRSMVFELTCTQVKEDSE